jgi:IS605 OrfB family transposase
MEEDFYHITIEDLDFKPDYKYKSKELNRLLSKFPFRIFDSLMVSKTARLGVKLKKVNPAYTSKIGIFKYAVRDNLSTKHSKNSNDASAALVILVEEV